jgi:hypothetical protein
VRGAVPPSVHYLQAKAMDPCDCVANERLGGKLKRSQCCGKRDEYVLRQTEYSCGRVWMSQNADLPRRNGKSWSHRLLAGSVELQKACAAACTSRPAHGPPI